ncbi:MAG: universal stress protein [Armatimonadota bacterium]
MIIQSRGDVIRLKGALVENQWPAIRSAVSLLLDDHPDGVVIDASGLTEITESGARTFLDAGNFIQAHNARVVVAGMSEEMLAVVRKIPGVRSQLVTAESVEEARASLETGSAASLVRRKGPAVLVPLIGAWRRAVEYAAAQAQSMRAEIDLLYILQVPRNLPIGVPLPDAEAEAHHSLDEAEKILKRRGVKVRKLTTRARDLAEGAGKFAQETNPQLVVAAFLKSEMVREGSRYAVMNALCHEAPCDVAVLCVGE